jgi:toxin-antitoxin system PIN domain toxin
MRALLDVNVLIALLDLSHQSHPTARRWLSGEIAAGWASCPLTQNGVIRIFSQPAYPNQVSASEAATLLRAATETPQHEFWTDPVSLLDPQRFDPTRIHGPRQVTDSYLLGLAVARGKRLVTLDRRIPLDAVHGARPQHLVIL